MDPEDLIALTLRNTATIGKCWRQRHDERIRGWIRDWLGELRYARYAFNQMTEADREEGLRIIRHDLNDLTLELPHALRPPTPRVLRSAPRR